MPCCRHRNKYRDDNGRQRCDADNEMVAITAITSRQRHDDDVECKKDRGKLYTGRALPTDDDGRWDALLLGFEAPTCPSKNA